MAPEAAPEKHEIEVRAAAGTLTFQDRRTIAHATALREGMRRGQTVAAIATELADVSRTALSRFMGSEKYLAALRASDSDPEPKKLTEEQAIEAARSTLANRLPEAVAFIENCFARDESKPERPYLDAGNAQWATSLLLKVAGLGENKGGGNAPPVVITGEAIRVMLGAVRGDDATRERAALPLPSVTVSVDKATVG